ncbi:FAD-dependent oxidoreductase [Patescibacteria group bacterium]|nr:FAD-dependent oxidoreductase [Patescibacteria group bacterium]
MTYDLIIIGGGPAGVAAGVYAARKRLKTLLIAPEFGGQSVVSDGIENWIGTVKISGSDLAHDLKAHLLAYAGETVDIKEGETVTDIVKNESGFIVKSESEYSAKSILIATGSTRRKLEIPGAAEFDNKGLTYCASCDGPLFSGQDVVVIGGGNAAFESAAQLLAYCKSVTLLNRTDSFKADEITISKLEKNPNFKIIKNAVPTEIKGDGFVKSIIYTDTKTGENHEIIAPGIFVEIGLIPTTYFAKNIIELNKIGQIPVDPRNQQTKVPGIWAAGDCTDGLYHQNNIASGDAVKALEDIYVSMHTK